MIILIACVAFVPCDINFEPQDKPVEKTPYTGEQLFADLKSDDKTANDRALMFLFTTDDIDHRCDELAIRKKDLVEALIPWLDNVKEQKAVLFVLGQIGPDAEQAVPMIVQFITESSNDRLAHVAQHTLRKIGPNAAAAVPALIESFRPFYFGRFDNISYRRDLPITLVSIAPTDASVREFLKKGLDDRDDGVRVHSAWKLWELGSRNAELKTIWEKALTDSDAQVRERVGVITAWLARKSPELLPIALTALKDPDPDVRKTTIGMLVKGNFTQNDVMNAYVECLSDSNWFVRSSACSGLGELGARAIHTIPQLKKTLEDEAGMVRVYGARALFAINPAMAPMVVQTLIEGLTHSSNHVRAAAAEGLGEMGSKARSALPALRHALSDEWSDVRKDAAEAIEKIEKDSSHTPKSTP